MPKTIRQIAEMDSSSTGLEKHFTMRYKNIKTVQRQMSYNNKDNQKLFLLWLFSK